MLCSWYHDILDSNGLLQCKMLFFVYANEGTYKYKRTFVLKKYVHSVLLGSAMLTIFLKGSLHIPKYYPRLNLEIHVDPTIYVY
jgi:hypothetical protein